MSRPNIVFLLADQLAAVPLSLYGAGALTTPHIDRLSGEGITFDNMISTCPVLVPFWVGTIHGKRGVRLIHAQRGREAAKGCMPGSYARMPPTITPPASPSHYIPRHIGGIE